MTGQTATDRHLRRSRRVWDRWSRFYRYNERDFGPLYDATVESLALEAGDAVLDVGCGPGANFERLREAVGPDGSVVGVEYSPAMVERARERIADNGWDAVTVRQADAASVDLPADEFDAALASLSLSVMPDVGAVLRTLQHALAPDAPLAILDLRTFQRGFRRIANPLLSLFYRSFANWNPDADVLAALEAGGWDVTVAETYAGGACYRALARAPST